MSHKASRHPSRDDLAAQGAAATAEPRTYHPAAVTSAVAIIRQAVCEDSARFIAALLALRPPGGPRVVDLAAIGETAGFEADPEVLWDRLVSVDSACARNLGVRVMTFFDESEDYRRKTARRRGFETSAGNQDPPPDRPNTITLSDELCALLDDPHPVPAGTDLPVPDAVTASWIAAVQAASASRRGHHLALRVVSDGREAADVAGLVAAGGARVSVVSDASRATLAAPVFRAELHAGPAGQVVVVEPDILVDTSTSADSDDDDGYKDLSWSAAVVTVDAQTTSALSWLRGLRNTYLWRVPAAGELPHELDGFLGGSIGPLGFDRAWSEGVIAAMAPGVNAKGAAALLSQVRDPRDASAMVAMVQTAATGTRSSVDKACALVARSFGARRGGLTPAQAPPPAFDPRLLVCDTDIGIFFERAEALARNGGRLLLWGPPGGGKTSLAQALARRMIGYPTIVVTPANILAYRWGAMERRLAALWSRAATEGAVILIDELDSLCAARDSGGSSNNNYLIRSLTNEWLRHLDTHPSVPILATVNDPAAIDDAVRRRFSFVVRVRDELTPDRERLAWTSILGLEPPAGWTPCGASVSDIALAKVRCRMLGLTDAAAFADAIVRARDARLGSAAKRRTKTASSLH